jgi:flagellar biosynthesis protein FlhF
MRIRRFVGPTMPQVLARVKASLGPDAVILETGQVAGGVSVTAAMDDDPPPTPVDGDRELVGEVRRLLEVVRTLVDDPTRGQGSELAVLHRDLVAQGVDGAIAAALVRAAAERVAGGAALATALAGALAATGAPVPPQRVRLFVGPPGDGKTTTVVKLAAAEKRAGRRVALVGTDTYRVGASAELATFGRALGVRVATAADAGELGRALAAAGDADVVLIDTAGTGRGEAAQLGELAALAAAAGPAAARTLVVSAASGSIAAAETWEAFAPLAPATCVLTKTDLAPGGAVLGLLWRRGVPVSHLATGRRIPGDLEEATPERLVRCLVRAA